ncbi:MAG: cupin domain-containing protein [Elusimicrobiota bacterium]|jgi:hypothetical protein
MGLPGVEELIHLYGLQPHPEGGYYRETYRSTGTIPRVGLPAAYENPRSFSTAILFLLPARTVSKLHRLRSDELWHFHLGGPLTITEILPNGAVRRTLLGPEVLAGQKLQHAVPSGAWFGAEPAPAAEYALVGATVSPGFDFSDFEMGRQQELVARFPHARKIIENLTEPRRDL